MDLNKMNTKDLLSLDVNTFNKLSVKELRTVVGKLASTANKRLKSFITSGKSTYSPAYRYVENSGGRFTTKGKTLNSLRAEYIRSVNFLRAETGTIRGTDRVVKQTIKTLKKQGINISVADFARLWQAYEKLKEIDPSVKTRSFKYTVLQSITDEIVDKDKTADEIAIEMSAKLTEIYEEQAARDDMSMSGFFIRGESDYD